MHVPVLFGAGLLKAGRAYDPGGVRRPLDPPPKWDWDPPVVGGPKPKTSPPLASKAS